MIGMRAIVFSLATVSSYLTDRSPYLTLLSPSHPSPPPPSGRICLFLSILHYCWFWCSRVVPKVSTTRGCAGLCRADSKSCSAFVVDKSNETCYLGNITGSYDVIGMKQSDSDGYFDMGAENLKLKSFLINRLIVELTKFIFAQLMTFFKNFDPTPGSYSLETSYISLLNTFDCTNFTSQTYNLWTMKTR